MIYLMRHGETVFNLAGRYQGQRNSALTERGRAQARRAGELLAARLGTAKIALFSSPLGRAAETARIVAAALPGAPDVQLDPRLQEIGFGLWEGLTRDEIDNGWPGARKAAGPGEWFFTAPEGERFQELAQRLAAAMADVAAAPEAVRIVVSHGVAGRVIRGLHAGLGREEMLRMHQPQDALFALGRRGAVERIPFGGDR